MPAPVRTNLAAGFPEYDGTPGLSQSALKQAQIVQQSGSTSACCTTVLTRTPAAATVTSGLADLVAHSDAIVSATVSRNGSYPTALNKFAFSVYSLQTSQVFKTNQDPSTPLYVIRAGGTVPVLLRPSKVHINVVASDPAYPDFVPGITYILFLENITGTSCFKATAARTFHVASNQVYPTGASSAAGTPLASFLASIKNAILQSGH